jgi:1-acyl-sn-glycerol-3-phosphate acyltransferase
MWLQPAVKLIANAAARGYYRLELDGPRVPKSGPVLLVANHPNGLLDPAVVVTAADRRVRFLAKSTLFTDPRLSWLVKGGGAIPVFRRRDDPTYSGNNEEMFRAAFEALAGGSAVGIFPEGTSHSEPALAELKTGAARIALGAHQSCGEAFPIVPIGITLRQKERFRSRALALLGEPVEWADLGPRGTDDREAVRELTTRIGEALTRVTVNLESWEDAPLVEWTEAIWAAENRDYDDRGEQLRRIGVISQILSTLRRQEGAPAEEAAAEVPELAAEVLAHRERLVSLHVEPRDLTGRTSLGYRFLDPLSVAIDFVGWLLFWLPYKLTGRIADLARPTSETRSTYRLLVGVLVYTAWVIGLAAVAAWAAERAAESQPGGLTGGLTALGAGLVTLVAVPVLGLFGLRIRERRLEQRRQWRKVSRTLRRRDLVPYLQAKQREIGGRLGELWEAWQRGEITAATVVEEGRAGSAGTWRGAG